jgi:uncharacterized protein (DUF1015 family)
MPRVSSFRALGYALDRYGSRRIPQRIRLPGEGSDHAGRAADLTDLACPPYDVISPALQRTLLDRDPHNAVRLELSPDADPHAAAAATLAAWQTDGTLERDREPSVYYYSHALPSARDDPVVHGVLARILLEPYGDGVRAHEHTMPGPRADRLGLLRATRTQLSPILAIYFDRSERYRHVMSRAWTDERRARDEDGLLHVFAAVEADDRLTGYLSRQQLFIADGHHRYETALAYQAEIRADPRFTAARPGSLAADWMMMVLVNAELEELEIRATHRLVTRADHEAIRGLVRDADPLFQAIPVPPDALAARLAELPHAEEPVFGLVFSDQGWLLVGDADGIAARMRSEPVASAVQRLDVAVLNSVILSDRLGLDPRSEAGETILYTKDSGEALARVASGEAHAAFLVRPTRLDQLAAVATAGDVMPEKSTYFYPKLLTGMAFYPLED